MGNECDQCEPNGACGREVLGRGIQPRAKLDLSRMNNNPHEITEKVHRGQARLDDKMQKNLFTQNSPEEKLNKVDATSTYDKQQFEKDRNIEIIELDNDVIFEGEIQNNYRDGPARYIWPDKTTLQAQYKKDVYEKKIRIDIPEELSYVGEVSQEAQIQGIGTMRFPDGSQYSGEWANGKPHGRGEHRMADNSIYEGQFFEGKKRGKGKYTFSNGSYYQGEFNDNKFEGEGTIKYLNGKSYTGQWRKGMVDGHGTLIYSEEKKYVGDFVEGMRHGKGIYYFGDGRYWEGQWQNNYQNGRGCYFCNGKKEQGYWKDGHMIDSSDRIFKSHQEKENRHPKQMIKIQQQP